MTDPTRPDDQPAGAQAPGAAGGPPPPPSPGSYGAAPPPPGGYQDPAPTYFEQAAPAGGAGRPGELMDRFIARVIDHALLFVVNMIITTFVIIGMLMNQSAGAFGVGGGNYASTVVATVLATAIYLGYFAYLESSRGQTVGKMLMKLETRGAGGGRPTIEEAVKRNIWVALGLIGLIPIIGGVVSGLAQLAAVIFIAVGISGDAVARRGWHDNFAGTQVVKIG